MSTIDIPSDLVECSSTYNILVQITPSGCYGLRKSSTKLDVRRQKATAQIFIFSILAATAPSRSSRGKAVARDMTTRQMVHVKIGIEDMGAADAARREY